MADIAYDVDALFGLSETKSAAGNNFTVNLCVQVTKPIAEFNFLLAHSQ